MSELRLRDYLLGRMAENDAERLEERLLEDQELFLQLRAVEDDLLDDVARGQVDASFLNSTRAKRLLFARALARRGTNIVPIARRWWITAAAAAAAAIAIVFLAQVDDRRPRLSTPAGQSVTRGQAAAPVLHAVSITLGTSRSSGAANVITIPKNATTLEFRVRINPADTFDRYAVELRTADGRIVAQSDQIKAVAEGGELVLPFAVPASSLNDGSYELAVHGDNEPLGFSTLEVHR